VIVRLATGSATVATIAASGVLSHAATPLLPLERSLLVLAIGSGSLFFSHVNDAGFWLVKESFGLSVADTLKTWSVLETVLSITGLSFALLLQLAL
jgi:GntP family gluconate:H+ symporter